jgi:hypothetical protein
VDFTARIDGRRTPKDAENIGRQMGSSASDGFDDTWSKGFRESLDKNARAAFDRWQKSGKQSGGAYGTAFRNSYVPYLRDAEKAFGRLRLDPGFLDDLNEKFGDAGLAARYMQERLVDLDREGKITNATFGVAQRQVNDWAEAQRQAAINANDHRDAIARLRLDVEASAQAFRDVDQVLQQRGQAQYAAQQERLNALFRDSERYTKDFRAEVDAMDAAFVRASQSTDRWALSWDSLSHNQRQWTAIIGAVIGGASDIAALGSLAGAGLIALGGAATSAVVGVGTLIPIIATLARDVEDLPEDLQGAATEARQLGSAFRVLGEEITRGAVQQAGGAFVSLQGTIAALTPELQDVGGVMGRLFGDLAENLEPGAEAFEVIRSTAANAAPQIDSLARSAGTLGVSLLRSFDRANPLVEDFIGYIDTLVGRFDDFSRSTAFDDWVARSRTSWGAFGDLLDETGRMLNDLVTPEAMNRLNAFLGNLEAFMPHLGQLLDVAGRLDIFGLIAQGLAQLGEALEPLADPVGDLAEAVSGGLSIAIETLADGITIVAAVTAPAVDLLAAFVDVAGESGVIEGAAIAVGTLAGAFLLLRGGGALAGAFAALDTFTTKTSSLPGVLGRAETSVRTFAGRAGALGVVAGVSVAAASGIQALIEELTQFDAKATEAVGAGRGLVDAGREIYGTFQFMGTTLEGTSVTTQNLAESLDQLGRQGGGLWNQFTAGFRGVAAESDALAQSAADLGAVLGQMDAPLADLANSNLPAAQEQLRAFAVEARASDTEILAMLDSMPKLKDALIQQVESTGQVATSQNLLAAALGETDTATRSVDEAMAGIEGRSITAGEAIDGLADKIRGFGSATLSTRDAEREFQASIDDATAALAENGATLDINTEQGRANQAAIDEIAQSALDFAAATYEETGSIQGATAAISAGREALILQLQAMGYTREEAERYADSLNLIPENIETIVKADTGPAQGSVEDFIRRNAGRRFNIYIDAINSGGGGGRSQQFMASGGVLTSPTSVVAGEAGPEAFVPLDRPLSQVDPSVRWLSAIAQGKGGYMASGGVVTRSGPQITVAEGAIVISGIRDERRAANEVIQRLIEDVVA